MKKRTIAFLMVFAFYISTVNLNVYGYTDPNIYIKNAQQVETSDFSLQDDFKVIQPINGSYNQYIDYPYGYSLHYPNHMWVDTTLSAVRTVIADTDTRIEIYYDNFKGTIHTADRYINYSNLFKLNKKDHTITKDENLRVNGLRTHLLKWHRDKISNLPNDKNYYVNAKIVKNQHEVYTIFIKSSKPIEDYMTIINSFRLVEKRGTAKVHTTYKTTEKNLNEATRNFYNQYFLKSDSLKWGIFEWTAASNYNFLNDLEKRLDYTFEFIVRYQTLDTNFPMEEMLMAYNNDKYVELTLQTKHTHHSDTDNPSITYDLLNGKYDEFLNQYARDMKEFGHPVLFRLNNEMNGDWCIYSSYFTSNDTELFKAVWHYIYNIFEKNGVDNALWVWNPHDISFPGFQWNHYLTYYPGDQYVDIIGLTGYNPGTHFKGESWKSFHEIYPSLYEEYTSLFQQPFMITEFGSSSIGGDKIGWIKDMFDTIDQFENIKVAIWWNGIDYDHEGNPGRIYRLDESDEMIEVFRNGLKKYK
ncbi:endoglucanase H [Clostridium aceticum]|uniref:Endoglucanase H n=1 Tax=Clostridium aceticum TaxID=84022 RepID=A0A0D8IH36_9CLOT|nr:glycosyl hydrolase [Clostridium aceticum]AKL94176.1 endoglucanase H [Clostridium aceticum]KJF28481.1 endoglucanase [Clostridium aceticum]